MSDQHEKKVYSLGRILYKFCLDFGERNPHELITVKAEVRVYNRETKQEVHRRELNFVPFWDKVISDEIR